MVSRTKCASGPRGKRAILSSDPSRLVPLLLLLWVIPLSGCRLTDPQFKTVSQFSTPAGSQVAGNQVNPSLLQPPNELFTLGPGDKLEIELLGDPTSRTTTIVGPDGKIYFNLLPGIDVWGLTLSQATAELQRQLGNYVREQPQVSIVLRGVESKRVWVLGRVQAPGVYALAAPITLLEAISMAGGTLSMSSYRDMEAAGVSEELADLDRSFVMREGKIVPVNFRGLLQRGDLSQNIYLRPDDFVYLPAATAREVYVLGAVTQPRPVPYREGMTVARAIASAYGTLTDAYLDHVVVVRGSLSQPEIATVDYKRVIRGQAKDIELQPKDIVYVPLSPYRYIDRYIQLAINTFASSAAINAGSKAVGGVPTGVGGVFIPVGSGIQIMPPITPPPPH